MFNSFFFNPLGIRPYKCRYCEMAFPSSGHRAQHEITHTGLSPYRCSLCDKEFKQLGNMHLHIAKHHGSYDKEVILNEIVIRQHGTTKKRGRPPKVKNEDNQHNNDYNEASNSILSL